MLTSSPLKKIFLALIAIISYLPVANATTELRCVTDMPSIKQDIMTISTSKDYNVILGYTYPPLILLFGGKKQYIEVLKETFSLLNNENVTVQVLSIAKPLDNILLSGKEICSIPIKLNINSSRLSVQADNYILAIRNLNTNTWKYVNGAESFGPSLLKSAIPDLPDSFKLPETTIMPIF